jgi:nicotinamidase-related amidase
MHMTRIMAIATLIATTGLALHVGQGQQVGARRIDLQRHDLSVPGREVVQTIVELAPGTTAPRHTHPGDIVALEHWCSSGFANTDLDVQLKQHGLHQLIVIGLLAHTCLESTVRFAAELGYQVTVVRDATAGYSDEEMHAALDINIPNYASAMVTTHEIVDLISSAQTLGIRAQ